MDLLGPNTESWGRAVLPICREIYEEYLKYIIRGLNFMIDARRLCSAICFSSTQNKRFSITYEILYRLNPTNLLILTWCYGLICYSSTVTKPLEISRKSILFPASLFLLPRITTHLHLRVIHILQELTQLTCGLGDQVVFIIPQSSQYFSTQACTL